MNEILPTLYPELNHILQKLVTSVQEILGDNFLGAYLQGSFAIGDYDEHSDVDFIIVMQNELGEVEIRALQTMHARIYTLDSHWAQHLEGSYFPKEVLRTPEKSDEQLWYLDNGSRALIKSTHCNTLVVRWVLWENGVILAGPAQNSWLIQHRLICCVRKSMM
ncbi:MAG: nucleotidyltransferase domain-containing protein [Anaerolineales bacterium]